MGIKNNKIIIGKIGGYMNGGIYFFKKKFFKIYKK